MNVLIVPGVGGSEPAHWQSWLQIVLAQHAHLHVVRVDQVWSAPKLNLWRNNFIRTFNQLQGDTIVVAHSFGVLTTIAALQSAEMSLQRIKGILLVAPADPRRFTTDAQSDDGFRQHHHTGLSRLLSQPITGINSSIPFELWASENDPWLHYVQAEHYAHVWGAALKNLGSVGHINVASGFGAWPELLHTLHDWLDIRPVTQRDAHEKERYAYYAYARK